MLTYFPTPLPGEWWYSVLCRYHVRSGHSKYATTINELYGGRPMVHGRLIPGGDCAAILSSLPPGVLSIDDVLANHTLLPYYTRFFAADKKLQVWEALRAGKGSGITSVRTQMPDGTEGLKYCPVCYHSDTTQYGEPYWHREHQIPLLPLCPTHKVPLVTVPVKFARLSEMFLPLVSIRCQEATTEDTKPWAEPLTDMMMALLCRGHVPTVVYNNLSITLLNAGYGVDKIGKQQALSVVKIQTAAREYYGEQIYEQYFAKLSAAILARLTNWKLSSPERYALLAVMAGLDADTLFGPTLDTTDPLLEELLCYKETGVVYAKNDLAVKMGIQPKQLDSLAKKYQFKPFWRQIRQDRNHCIRLLLTDSEYDMLSKGAKENGSAPLAVFVREIVLDVVANREKKTEEKASQEIR